MTSLWSSRNRTLLSCYPRVQQQQIKQCLMLLALGMLLGLSAFFGLQRKEQA